MDLQKNSIDLFLQSVCRFVWDDEKAKDIQDELKDHTFRKQLSVWSFLYGEKYC